MTFAIEFTKCNLWGDVLAWSPHCCRYKHTFLNKYFQPTTIYPSPYSVLNLKKRTRSWTLDWMPWSINDNIYIHTHTHTHTYTNMYLNMHIYSVAIWSHRTREIRDWLWSNQSCSRNHEISNLLRPWSLLNTRPHRDRSLAPYPPASTSSWAVTVCLSVARSTRVFACDHDEQIVRMSLDDMSTRILNTPQHAATCCNTLQHCSQQTKFLPVTVIDRMSLDLRRLNTHKLPLQHTATHCSALQHTHGSTATRC